MPAEPDADEWAVQAGSSPSSTAPRRMRSRVRVRSRMHSQPQPSWCSRSRSRPRMRAQPGASARSDALAAAAVVVQPQPQPPTDADAQPGASARSDAFTAAAVVVQPQPQPPTDADAQPDAAEFPSRHQRIHPWWSGQSTNLPQDEAAAAAQPLPAQAKADVFNDAATQPVETLRAKKMSLSKNNLDDEVRKAGGALSTDRALLLARVLK